MVDSADYLINAWHSHCWGIEQAGEQPLTIDSAMGTTWHTVIQYLQEVAVLVGGITGGNPFDNANTHLIDHVDPTVSSWALGEIS